MVMYGLKNHQETEIKKYVLEVWKVRVIFVRNGYQYIIILSIVKTSTIINQQVLISSACDC